MGNIRQVWNRSHYRITVAFCFFLLWILMGGMPLSAQEGARVVGTEAAASILGAGLKSGLVSVNAELQTLPASESLTQFCSGEADALLRLSPLDAGERENCALELAELLIGHQIYALVSGSEIPKSCLNEDELDLIFAPSAANRIVDWQQIDEALEEPLPVNVWLPERNDPSYILLDHVVSGIGFRDDASLIEDEGSLYQGLSENAGSIGLVELTEMPAGIIALQLESGDIPGCQAATVSNVEAGTYPLAISVYLYVNRSMLSQESVFSLAEASGMGALSSDLSLPSVAAREINRSLLTDDSQIVSVASDSFVIPSIIGGQVSVGGVAEANIFLPNLVDAFTASYPSLISTTELRGGPAGETALCSSVIDVAFTFNALSEEAMAICEESGITVLTLKPAALAAVALSNHDNTKLRCMDPERWAEIWAWQGDADPEEDTELLLIAPPDGHIATDIMMIASTGEASPIRRDAEISDDPLWRAAAVGVVENGLSYFDWGEYQTVLSAEQPNIQAIRMGENCIEPTAVEILNGGYPLGRPLFAHINANTLASVQLKSWLWFAFGGSNQALLGDAGLVLPDGVAMRRDLLQAFAEADALVLAASQAEDDVELEDETSSDDG